MRVRSLLTAAGWIAVPLAGQAARPDSDRWVGWRAACRTRLGGAMSRGRIATSERNSRIWS